MKMKIMKVLFKTNKHLEMDIDYDTITNTRIKNEVRALLGEGVSRVELTNGDPVSTDGILMTNIVVEQTGTDFLTSVYLRFLDGEKTSKEVKITYPLGYPFKPPKVLVGDENYFTLLTDLASMWRFIPGNKKHKKICPHCTTIMCRGNWGPCMNTFVVCNEIRHNILIVRNALKTVLLNTIINTFLKGIYVPIESFLLDKEFVGMNSCYWSTVATGKTL